MVRNSDWVEGRREFLGYGECLKICYKILRVLFFRGKEDGKGRGWVGFLIWVCKKCMKVRKVMFFKEFWFKL